MSRPDGEHEAGAWQGREAAQAASAPLAQGIRSRAELEERLVRFINEVLPEIHGPLRKSPGVDRDTALFESRVIDSLTILHLVLFIEQATGRRVSHREVLMRHFRTVRAIAETFWSEG
jgi:acyl carrier protein